jgi:hypothetical protein
MGCSNAPTDNDAKMLEEAALGASSGIDPTLLDASVKQVADQVHQTLETLAGVILDVLPLSAFDVMTQHNSQIYILPSTPPAASREQAAKHLRGLKDKDILVFEERGRLRDARVATTAKYSSSVPAVDDKSAIAQPLIPTKENLVSMLNGRAPLDPLDPKQYPIELHHYQQRAERLIPMRWEQHRGKGVTKMWHSGEKLPDQDREAFPAQKEDIWRAQAEEYLGEYWVELFEENLSETDE